MDLELLRRSLKLQWLSYYQENRHWLVKLGIWITSDGQRRPSSSFIVATLTLLEPQLMQMLPLIVDLNNDPDQIVRALGLDFSPETELKALKADHIPVTRSLPSETMPSAAFSVTPEMQPVVQVDESCRGAGRIRRD